MLMESLHQVPRRATREAKEGRPCLLFFKSRKNSPDFEKKGPDCVYLWVRFSI